MRVIDRNTVWRIGRPAFRSTRFVWMRARGGAYPGTGAVGPRVSRTPWRVSRSAGPVRLLGQVTAGLMDREREWRCRGAAPTRGFAVY
jgi:hypothetical protein